MNERITTEWQKKEIFQEAIDSKIEQYEANNHFGSRTFNEEGRKAKEEARVNFNEIAQMTASRLFRTSKEQRPAVLKFVIDKLGQTQHGSTVGLEINFLTQTLMELANLVAPEPNIKSNS